MPDVGDDFLRDLERQPVDPQWRRVLRGVRTRDVAIVERSRAREEDVDRARREAQQQRDESEAPAHRKIRPGH